jgi:hypothetical protein
MAPTLFTSCNALPPEGANFPRGGPSENCSLLTLTVRPSHRGTGFAGPQVAPPLGGGAEGASGGV